ncbi:family 43 glycosylhydrolase [Sinomicrobium sp.]
MKLKLKTPLIFLFAFSLFLGCSDDDNGNQVTDNGTMAGIRKVTPATALPGNHVIINGVNFGSDEGAIKVMFDEEEAEIVAFSAGRIEAVVPPDTDEAGYAKIQLEVAGVLSNQYYFTYGFSQPSIASITDAHIGELVKISGTGFGNKPEHTTVTFGGADVELLSVADTLIQVNAPDLSGSISMDVQVKVGEKTSSVVTFTYLDDLYANPVVAQSLPDPTVIRAQDGMYYLYATEDIRNTPIMRSKDLVSWEQVGTAFTDETRPTFEPGGGLWAPDIQFINGQYVLYYSMSVWGGEWTCGIGVATSDSPEGPFTDHGKLFQSEDIGVQNSIDPNLVEDNGKKYLFWGSFRGIYMIEMNDDGLSVKEGAEKQQVAGTWFEGVNIHKRDNYYYMFASIGSCCEGINSTYQLVVGRSENLAGPYVNRSGTDMMVNGYTLVIDKNESFVGNGHSSEIVQDDAGNDWILYHGVRTSDPSGRVLMLDQIQWDEEGWPYITSGTPSTAAMAPVINN